MSVNADIDPAIESVEDPEFYDLRLYVVANTPRSVQAMANLKRICEENIPGKYHIEVMDLSKNPQLARNDQILAIPTVVRRLPEPIRKMIGNLSSIERVLVGLDIVRHDVK